jgi:hypothetical protein
LSSSSTQLQPPPTPSRSTSEASFQSLPLSFQAFLRSLQTYSPSPLPLSLSPIIVTSTMTNAQDILALFTTTTLTPVSRIPNFSSLLILQR